MDTHQTDQGRICQQMTFLLEIDKLKLIQRKNWVGDGSRAKYTNSACSLRVRKLSLRPPSQTSGTPITDSFNRPERSFACCDLVTFPR